MIQKYRGKNPLSALSTNVTQARNKLQSSNKITVIVHLIKLKTRAFSCTWTVLKMTHVCARWSQYHRFARTTKFFQFCGKIGCESLCPGQSFWGSYMIFSHKIGITKSGGYMGIGMKSDIHCKPEIQNSAQKPRLLEIAEIPVIGHHSYTYVPA